MRRDARWARGTDNFGQRLNRAPLTGNNSQKDSSSVSAKYCRCAPPKQRIERGSAAWAAYSAKEWIHDNPDAYRHLVGFCLNEAGHERKFSFRRAIEEVRAKDYSDIQGRPFKINNNMTPALARIIVKEHPEVAPFIEFRRASCDGLV